MNKRSQGEHDRQTLSDLLERVKSGEASKALDVDIWVGLGLWTPPGFEDRIGTFSHIVFKCADLQATYEELRARGVEFTQEPTDQPGGAMAQFKDPDGNIFVLG